MMILFQSKRLLFRQFTPDDAELIYDLNSDPEVVKYVHEPETTTENAPQVLRDIILPQYESGLGRWAVFLKYTDEFIGWCGLKYLAESNEIDLGYRFKKKYWGQGYASEAASTCISYAFEHLEVSKIIARSHVENSASLKVIEKCGMNFLKEEVVDNCPVKTYSLVKSGSLSQSEPLY
jgi:[ribosomal protein S5]-alanine N-acetyltransferase